MRKNVVKCLIVVLFGVFVLNGCAMVPMGPTVRVLPGAKIPYDQFQRDDQRCQNEANEKTAPAVSKVNGNAILKGIVGTVVGTALGAAGGAAFGNAGAGAGIGTATGGILGTAAGADGTTAGQNDLQSMYNNIYMQCMYAAGHQVPGLLPR